MTIAQFDGQYRCEVKDNAIHVRFVEDVPGTYDLQHVSISFQRTIRVPDDGTEYRLPPNLGDFPLFKVRDYDHRLPSEMAAKGGLFMPMYQKEAMWINFVGVCLFMVKIYVGGVNAISGEHSIEDARTKARRLKRIEEGKSIQDYIVTPGQRWLDGVAVSPGVVRQFVAMPMGQGYTVEAQLTGKEVVGGLQFEITPTIPPKLPCATAITPVVGIPACQLLAIPFSPMVTLDFTPQIYASEYIPPSQERLISSETQLEDSNYTMNHDHAHHGATAFLASSFGGDDVSLPKPMGIAMSGKIAQAIYPDHERRSNWLKDCTMTISVQILDSATFRQVTGEDPPPSPVDAFKYAEAGFPFFKLWEDPSSVAGGFEAAKSVNQIEQDRGLAQGSEASVYPRTVELNSPRDITSPNQYKNPISDPDSLLNPDGPLREFRTLADMLRDLKIGTC
ncbi:hypothetical protein F5B19DRAFT_91845 [Rostrohypoxylon terebratum]|nr:hypothetical protein F5B19DRAFT_91845 [Rostrohypoxylon terebratum]